MRLLSGALRIQCGTGRAFSAALAVAVLAAPALADGTQRISVSSSGVQDNTGASQTSYVTPDGRWIVFQSTADNLVAGDTNGVSDIFVRDRLTGTTARVSLPHPSTGNTQANGPCFLGRSGVRYCSDDGRHVVFVSSANNLVAGDTNGDQTFQVSGDDIFVRDRDLDGNGIYDEPGVGKTSTVRVSVTSNGSQWNPYVIGQDTYGGYTKNPSISANGRFVAFQASTDFLSNETGTSGDNVYWHDRDNDGNGIFDQPGDVCVIIIQGGCITYPGDITLLVSKVRAGASGQNGPSENPAISGDGAWVAFQTASTRLDYDLVFDNDSNSVTDIYVRNMFVDNAKATRVSVRTNESQVIDSGSSNPSISHNGRYIAFQSGSSSMDTGDTNGVTDVFVRDRGTPNGNDYIFSFGRTYRVSYGVFFGVNGWNRFSQIDFASTNPAISPDGRYVAFVTEDPTVNCSFLVNCANFDTNAARDVYVRDTLEGVEFTRYVSYSSAEGNPNGASFDPSINGNGKVVTFTSSASNAVLPDANGASNDVYARVLSPAVTAWRSVRSHATWNNQSIALNATATGNGVSGPTSEPRNNGIQRVEVDFDGILTTAAGPFTAVDLGTNTPIAASSFNVVNGGKTLQINFNNGVLPNQKCYLIDLGSGVGDMAGDDDVQIRGIVGDANGDGSVTLIDFQQVKSKIGQSLLNNFRFDVNLDGTLSLIDAQLVKSRVGHTTTCP